MKYEMLWLNENGTAYSNYSRNKKELKSKLNYFMNEKGLSLNDTDRVNNIQVSKKIGKNLWLILTQQEVLNEIK